MLEVSSVDFVSNGNCFDCWVLMLLEPDFSLCCQVVRPGPCFSSEKLWILDFGDGDIFRYTSFSSHPFSCLLL